MRFGAIPALVLSQTCGYPFATRLRGMVRLVGTPIYDVPGLRRTVLFQHDRRTAPTSRQAACGARPDGASPSTAATASRDMWLSVRRIREAGLDPGAVEWIETGSHRASMRAVAEEEADVAAIDAVCWSLALRHEPKAVSRLKVLGHDASPPRPAVHHRGGAARRARCRTIRSAIEGCHRRSRRRAKQRRRLA